MLSHGIGDTLRVSLAADPVEEVKVGFEILKSLELRHRGINVIACPTCGRVEIDVVRMANELEKQLGHIKTPLNVSVLGCVVNGIGEGKEADIGIAGGEGKGILFKKGKLVRKVPIADLMDTLIRRSRSDGEREGSRRRFGPGPRNERTQRQHDLGLIVVHVNVRPRNSRSFRINAESVVTSLFSNRSTLLVLNSERTAIMPAMAPYPSG